MGVSGSIAAVAALASAASATNSIISGSKAEHDQKIQAQIQSQQLTDQTQKADQLASQTAADSAASQTAASQASIMQRQRASSAFGRGSTILTGATGVSAPAQTQKKTLLGM